MARPTRLKEACAMRSSRGYPGDVNWRRLPIVWQAAKVQLSIQFGERFVFKDRSM